MDSILTRSLSLRLRRCLSLFNLSMSSRAFLVLAASRSAICESFSLMAANIASCLQKEITFHHIFRWRFNETLHPTDCQKVVYMFYEIDGDTKILTSYAYKGILPNKTTCTSHCYNDGR